MMARQRVDRCETGNVWLADVVADVVVVVVVWVDRDRQGARQPVPDQRQREEADGAARTDRTGRQPLRKGLRPRQRVSRRE